MKKLSLTVIGLYVSMLAAFSQDKDTAYKNKKLSLEEIDFVSGYYRQDGNHSAVTGGEGSEKLSDFANSIELKFSKFDRHQRKHEVNFGLGIDHYSSASSDKIDPHTISSASSADTRIYPSIGWSIQNLKKKNIFGISTSFSNEFDYKSFGIGTNFSKTSKNNDREFGLKLQAYFDQWKVILPIELRTGVKEASEPRNSYSASLSLSQIVNRNFQLMLIAEPTFQNGLLATKYQRVYFTDGSLQSETLPDRRFKIPIGIRANYFLGDRFILRSFYRYYRDDWGLQAHTADIEVPVKITPFFSVSPFYRFYSQNAVQYFAPYGSHHPGDQFFTSDYDLSKFTSNYFGAGLRLSPPSGVFHIRHLGSMEVRYGHYQRSDGLNSNQVSLALKFR